MAAVMPHVDGPAEPDAVIGKNGERVYVEVETGDNRDAKWRHQVELQGFVAVCTVTESQKDRLIAEIKGLGLPGRATCLETLMQDKKGVKGLWAEDWEA